MSKIVIMVGPPGSGKSTYSKALFPHYTYVNGDSQGKQHLEIFKKAVEANENIVVDRMGFNKDQRNRYLTPAKEKGYESEIVVLHESYETCFTRCTMRIGHETIKDETNARNALDTFFTKYERPLDDEADKVTRIWPVTLKPNAVWSDLDGTLCDCEHRRHFVRPDQPTPDFKKNWPGFFDAMVDDTVNWPVMRTLCVFARSGYEIVYCSGRPDSYKKHTETWLNDNGAPVGRLFMRNRKDSRRDDIVKEILLDFEVLTRYTVLLCLDDRDQVVKMLRGRGFPVFQVAEGNF